MERSLFEKLFAPSFADAIIFKNLEYMIKKYIRILLLV